LTSAEMWRFKILESDFSYERIESKTYSKDLEKQKGLELKENLHFFVEISDNA